MSEKTDIEKASADAFLRVYNAEMGTSYTIVEYSDTPDVGCADPDGNQLNLEMTLTEDRRGDIKALLGRSDERSLEALEVHLEKVRAGKANPLERVSSLAGNVTDMVVCRIRDKMNKRYGPHIALVVRDSSGVDWDWDLVIGEVHSRLKEVGSPFDKGIWILSSRKNRIFRVV